jgi:uncharacterized protein
MPRSRDNPAGDAAALQFGTQSPSTLCVYCRRQPVDPRWRPFCGQRCRLQDLARWIDGDYRVAGEEISQEPMPPVDADDRERDQ